MLSAADGEWATAVTLCTAGGIAAAVLCGGFGGSSTEAQRRRDGEEFVAAGRSVLDWLVDYRQRCHTLPTVSQVQPDYLRKLVPAEPPEHPEPWSAVLADLDRAIVPGLTHWESERFFAQVDRQSAAAACGVDLCFDRSRVTTATSSRTPRIPRCWARQCALGKLTSNPTNCCL
jgi:hypothetical protein